MAAPVPVYFTDENTLGLGTLLRRAGRDDVVYPGRSGSTEVRRAGVLAAWFSPVRRFRVFVVRGARG